MATMTAVSGRKIEMALAAARRALQSAATESAAATGSTAATAPSAAGKAADPAVHAVGELTRLAGLGPARARRLFEELGVSTLTDLDAALEAGRVAALRGFSTTLEAHLRQQLDALRQPGTRLLLPDAEVHVERLLHYMERAPGIEHVEVAGSYRRRAATLGDIDILVVSTRPAAVMRYFTTYADAASATALDPSRGALTLNCGLRVELRIVPRRCYGATLHYLTGSIAYNNAIRSLGLEKGVRVTEYGVFGLAAGRAGARRLGGQREEDVFDALGLPWLPPELRENSGEIEAALAGRVPALVALADIRGDLVLRTRWSSGTDTAEAMVRACRERGYAWCGIADAAGTQGAHGLSRHTLREQSAEIERLRRRIRGIHVLRAMQAVIGAGRHLEMITELRDVVDLVIGVVPAESRRTRAASLDAVATALQAGAIDVLSTPFAGTGTAAKPDRDAGWDAVVRAAADHAVPILISAAPDALAYAAQHARRAHELGAQVVLGSAAESVAGLARMRFAVDQARRGWLAAADVLNTLDDGGVLRWLRRRRRTGRT